MSENLDGTISAMLWVESDDFHPDAVTDCLGRQPTDVQIKGDLTGSGKSHFKKHFWNLSFGEREPEYFHQITLPEILGFLAAKREALVQLRDAHGCRAWLSIVVRKSANHIGILLNPEDAVVIAEAGVGVDLSICD